MDLRPSPSAVNKVMIPAMRQIFTRPRLANALFGRDRWGNPFGDERYSNPYPMFEAMRADGAVAYRALYRIWFVTGHDEIQQVLSHPDTSTHQQLADLMGARPYSRLRPETRDFYLNFMLVRDAPDHPRLRRLVNRAFTPARIADLEPQVRDVSRRLIDDLRGRDTIEIVDTYNGRLPVDVIAAMIGIPEERWDWARQLVRKLTLFFNPFEPWAHEEVDDAVAEFSAYVLALAGERRAEPRDDLMSVLVEAADDGDRLSPDELVANAGLLFFAGFDTTMSQLGNALIALADHPDQRRLIRERPELWPNAVEELLRYDGPVGMTQRYARADITIGDHLIPAGSNLAVMIPAGNRDPLRWDDPDRLILDRPDPKPITFGHGVHHCLGHALARLELRVALKDLVDELGDYTIDRDSIVWRRDLALKGPTRMLVARG